nr:hypothetical protein [Streptacidiphilus rugosus]
MLTFEGKHPSQYPQQDQPVELIHPYLTRAAADAGDKVGYGVMETLLVDIKLIPKFRV